MFKNLSLRVRIFLFFCLLAFGAIVLAAGALAIGWMRADDPPREPFTTAFVAFLFFNTGLTATIWFLFDQNVAKPIHKLSTELRLRAHSGLNKEFDLKTARYLGDLAPAAHAISNTLSDQMVENAAEVARETERLQAQANQLTKLLTQIPVATIVANSADEIVLYDGQAADLLSHCAEPRLKAPLSVYLDDQSMAAIRAARVEGRSDVTLTLRSSESAGSFSAQIKPLDDNGYMLTVENYRPKIGQVQARPLVYDFDLLETNTSGAIYETPLRNLCFVTFDTETTGLSVKSDMVVQMAAVRVINGRIVRGETFETFVNPGRKIPPASTRIHKITDSDVAGAPVFDIAARRFHTFASDSVLVAHNAPFDLAFMRRNEKKMGIVWDHPVIDTVLLSAIVFGVTEDHTLDALCERLSITIEPDMRHTALGDAQATAEALVKMLPLLEARGLNTLGRMIEEAKKYGVLLKDLN